MKELIYIVDIECDSLEPTKIWTLSYSLFIEGKTPNITTLHRQADILSFLSKLEEEKATIVGHNFILFDMPSLEKILGRVFKIKIIDTLPLTWYLYPNMMKPGLEAWGEELGFPKVVVPDEEWVKGDLVLMTERCETDVQINYKVYQKMIIDLRDLYEFEEDLIEKIQSFLSFIMEVFQYQSAGIVLDVEKCKKTLAWFSELLEDKIVKLKKIMPPREIIKIRKIPKVMVKKDGSDSAHAVKWFDFLTDYGLPDDHTEPVSYVSGYEEPNPGSNTQIKDWLFKLGWEPQTFSLVPETARDEEGKKYKTGVTRKVPQIKKDGQLCPSVELLAEKVPELEELVDYGVITHRMGLLKGFLKNVNSDGIIKAEIAGLASTIRCKHKTLVNLPGITGKGDIRDGIHIRELLTAGKGFKMIGSDVSGLETTTADHFMYPFDPEYVLDKRQPGFDSHLDMAISAGLMTVEETLIFKELKEKKELNSEEILWLKEKNTIRQKAKTTNFASQYSVGANTLARNLGISKKEAQVLIRGYWERNYSIKEACKNPTTKTFRNKTWIKHPINNFWYQLRSQKDVFSVYCQGGGSYIFFIWVYILINKYKIKNIVLNMHDEILLRVPDNEVIIKETEEKLKFAMEDVNNLLDLHVDFSIDTQNGDSYAACH